LVVDDEEMLLDISSSLLAGSGYGVLSASNRSETVEKYRELMGKRFCHVVIMDHQIPIKNDLEVSREILSLNPDAKILFSSAGSSVKQEAFQIGVTKFLGKTMGFDKLLLKKFLLSRLAKPC